MVTSFSRIRILETSRSGKILFDLNSDLTWKNLTLSRSVVDLLSFILDGLAVQAKDVLGDWVHSRYTYLPVTCSIRHDDTDGHLDWRLSIFGPVISRRADMISTNESKYSVQASPVRRPHPMYVVKLSVQDRGTSYFSPYLTKRDPSIE